jgi:hypothetical protein
VQIVSYGAALLLLRGYQAFDQCALTREEVKVVNGNGGVGAKRQHGSFIFSGKRQAALLVCKVKASEDGIAAADWYSEETLHRRMVGWKAY